MKKSKSLLLLLLPVLTMLAFALFPSSSSLSDGFSPDLLNNGRIIDREKWKYLNNDVKFSVYCTFPNEKKKEFWRLKYEELKKLDWNTTEREHIKSLYEIICEHPELMERGTGLQEQEDEFLIFLYNWTEQAREMLGWTPKTIYAIAASGDEVLDTDGRMKSSGINWGITYRNSSFYHEGDCSRCKAKTSSHFPFFIPYVGNCRAYFLCLYGTAHPQLCPRGQRFSPFLLVCMPADLVYCPDDLD